MKAAMSPHGAALLAYWKGDRGAQLLMRRDDGFQTTIPVSEFFREEPNLYVTDRAALTACRGSVLDCGAGAGVHSLALQAQGFEVTAIDIDPGAVAVTRQRGVKRVECANILDYAGGPFDTVLMLGHGIGMLQTLAGLDAFLCSAARLLRPGGQILADSLDVQATENPMHAKYHDANEWAGRYRGETRLQFKFNDVVGSPCDWLHVDPLTLKSHAEQAGWVFEQIAADAMGNYLARLTRAPAVQLGAAADDDPPWRSQRTVTS